MNTCSKCDQPCDVVKVNETIEISEFWGSIAYHTEYDLVSDCCDAELEDDD